MKGGKLIGIAALVAIAAVLAKSRKEKTVAQLEAKPGKNKFCPNCGEKIPQDARFCIWCGVKMEDYSCAEIKGLRQHNPAL